MGKSTKHERACRHRRFPPQTLWKLRALLFARAEEAGREAGWAGWQPAWRRKRGLDAPLRAETEWAEARESLQEQAAGEKPVPAGSRRIRKFGAMNCGLGRASSRVAISRHRASGTSHHYNNQAPARLPRQVRRPDLPASFPVAAVLEAISSCERMIARRPRQAVPREDHNQAVFCIGPIKFSRDGIREKILHQFYRNIALVFPKSTP
jgi:hypothetical protein